MDEPTKKVIGLDALDTFKSEIDKEIVAQISNVSPDDIGAITGIKIGTVTTGAAGSKASAEISIIGTVAMLNLTIPKGDKGETGVSGTNATVTATASQNANGLMSASDKTKLDGVATGANKYVHPTTSGNKHIPAGGASGQILRWSADGTAAWGADNNTTYSAMKAATASAAGAAGLVPAPAAGAQNKYLRGDGTWQTPPDTNTTYGNASTTAAGLVSAGTQTFAGNKTFNGSVICGGAGATGTAQARNIYAGTSDLTAGTSALSTGTIYIMYE